MTGSPAAGGIARWTRRAYLLLGLASLLVALAVALRNPVLLFAALPFLLAPLSAAVNAPRHLTRVDLSWQASGLGSDVELSGTLTGTFGDSIPDLFVALPQAAGTTELRPVRYRRAPGAIRFAVNWRFHEPTIMTLDAPQVVWRDSLGLSERLLDGARPPLPLERYPPELHGLATQRLARTTALPGETRSRRIGASGEFFGLRDALPHEPPRRINWRATARTGRPLANEYLLDRTGDLLLLLDVRPTALGPEYDERLLNVARAALYGMAESFLRSKVRIAYATFGEFVDAVPLSTGRAHRLRLLQAILASRRSEVAGPAERCAFGLRRFFRPGLTTLIVSAWPGDPVADLAPYVRRQGFPVIVLSPSPLPMREGLGALRPEDEELARRLERLERRERLATLWTHAPVVDWSDYWSLGALARLMREPPRRRVS